MSTLASSPQMSCHLIEIMKWVTNQLIFCHSPNLFTKGMEVIIYVNWGSQNVFIEFAEFSVKKYLSLQ